MWTCLQKSGKEVSPQITVSKSTKSRRKNWFFLTQFILKQLPIHDETKIDKIRFQTDCFQTGCYTKPPIKVFRNKNHMM